MKTFLSALREFFLRAKGYALVLWTRYRALPRWWQVGIAALLVVAVIGAFFLFQGGKPVASAENLRAVTLKSVAELSGEDAGGSVIGSVRARSEATMLAQASGSVESVRTTLGARVPAGFVIAEIENASQEAAVLQAEGSYDAAVAARNATSLPDTELAAANVYRNAFSTLDNTLQADVDAFFGPSSIFGPTLEIDAGSKGRDLSEARAEISDMMNAWRRDLGAADARDPGTLLDEADAKARIISDFLVELGAVAGRVSAGTTAAQTASLSQARATVSATLSTLAAAKTSYRTGSVGSSAGADASVKQALGSLRLAQAALEKTRVRAPIAGTVNFLPIRTGDYVTALMHVATVAENGALEVVTYVSEETSASLVPGMKVSIDDGASGVITSISPALDPVTRQIEVRIAVESGALVNGQSVRIGLPNTAPAPVEGAVSEGPILLPLASVKLATDSRVVFTVGEGGRLVAIPVEIGDVRGERIEIRSNLSTDTRIVTDARGLSEGQQVRLAGE